MLLEFWQGLHWMQLMAFDSMTIFTIFCLSMNMGGLFFF
jgi:hypothetical protein